MYSDYQVSTSVPYTSADGLFIVLVMDPSYDVPDSSYSLMCIMIPGY